jgi:uncharacterized protein (TIGR02217 family)
MLFTETRFPDSIAFGSASISEFNTSVITMKNGIEQRNINWSDCRLSFNILNGVKTKNELAELLAFFKTKKGKAIGFRFKDWSDYKAFDQILGIGDETKTEFQLIKNYISGSTIYMRAITKPLLENLVVYLNNSPATEYKIDLTTGIITFDNPPPQNITIKADFEFDVPVRFDSDILEISMESIHSGRVKEIKLVEILPF